MLIINMGVILRYTKVLQIKIEIYYEQDIHFLNYQFQTNDLRVVHRGVKFTCRFTVSELQSRWYALLYNAEISRVAVAAMRNLHPDLVTAVQQQALYSTAEEELLGTLSSVSIFFILIESFLNCSSNCSLAYLDRYFLAS